MARIHRGRRERIAALATVLALACGDDDPTGNSGSIQVAVEPTTLSVPQGASGLVDVTLTRTGSFNGVVTLTVTGLPTGITATVTPTQLSGTTTSASVTLTVAAAVAPATHTATLTATAPGVNQVTATFALTVSAAPNYALMVAPPTLTVPAGTSGTASINIARTNFTGGVALALQNPPPGITAAFDPTPSTTNISALTLNVAAAVAPGGYPLTIQGTATGPGVKTAALTLTVTAPPTGPTSVEYQFCDASAAPVFFAYQDGTGAWQPVAGSTFGGTRRYPFSLTQGRGGVLIVYRAAAGAVADARAVGRTATVREVVRRPSRARAIMDARRDRAAGKTTTVQRSFLADTYMTELLYASATELAQDGAANCDVTQPTKSVTGTVLGVSAGQYGIVSLGFGNDLFIGGTSTNPVTFEGVLPGPMDFVGSRMTPGNPPDRIIVLRNLDIPDGGALPAPIDFNAATTAPATANATITGSSGDDLEIFIDVVTANTDALLWFDLSPSPATTRPWAGLGPTTMATGDFHGIYAFANPRPFDANNYRFALKYVGPVSNQTLSLGPGIGAPTVSQVAAGAYPRYRFQGTIPPEYGKGASVDVLSAEEGGNTFTIIATGAYLAASGNAMAYDFTMPDIVGVAGFPGAARLTTGQNDVAVGTFGFTGPGIFDVLPTLGSEFRAAVRGATIIAP